MNALSAGGCWCLPKAARNVLMLFVAIANMKSVDREVKV